MSRRYSEMSPVEQEQWLVDVQDHLKLPRKPTYRQAVVLLHPHKGGDHPCLYGGGKGGGKSALGVMGAVSACRLVKNNRALLARDTYGAFMDSTFEELKAQIEGTEDYPPCEDARISVGKHRVYFNNGSEIWWMGLRESRKQSLQEAQKVGSTQFGYFFLDEGPETTRKAFKEVLTRLRHTPASKLDMIRAIVTGNPYPGWIKEDFITKPVQGYHFVRSLMRDNPYLPPEYEEMVRGIYADDPQMIAAMIEGDWNALSETDQAIPELLLTEAALRTEVPDYNDVVWGIDVSRKGTDWTTVWVRYGYVFRRLARWQGYRTTQSARQVASLFASEPVKPRAINVDASGVGGGMIDELVALVAKGEFGRPGVPIVECMGGSAANDVAHFTNKNAELIFLVLAMLQSGRGDIKDSEDLVFSDLGAFWAGFSGQRRKVSGNEEIRSRLGRSPDDGNAFMYTLYEGERQDPGKSDEQLEWDNMDEDQRQRALIIKEQQERGQRQLQNFFGQVPGLATPFGGDDDDTGVPY